MKRSVPVVLANAERLDFKSEVNGRSYSMSVALPLVQVPEKGCPVLYVLDGHWYFASAVEAVRANAPEVVVVGVSYPEDDVYVESVLAQHRPLPAHLARECGPKVVASLQRMYDLSLPISDEVIALDFLTDHGLTSKDLGGVDNFLKTLETEVKSRVAAMIRIDSSNQAIFGHSLGGLAVLHALFAVPNTYRTFIASSPVIWWNEKAVLAAEASFGEAVRAGTAGPRVLITMGGEEETPDPRIAARSKLDFGRYAALLRKHRMVESARELTERLKAMRGSGGFEVEDYAPFPKQGHGISPWPALGRAVVFAFPP